MSGEKKEKKLMPLAKKPLGENKIHWCNNHMSTTLGVTCEICGTEYPELDPNDDGYTISTFLGRQVVEECCGGIIDIIFEESGEEITRAYLGEFAENPTSPEFYILKRVIARTFEAAKKNMEETNLALKEAQANLDDIVELEK